MWLTTCLTLVLTSLTAQVVHADDFTSHSKMCYSNVLSKCKQKYAFPTPNKSLTHHDDPWHGERQETETTRNQICSLFNLVSGINIYVLGDQLQLQWITCYYLDVECTLISLIYACMKVLFIQFTRHLL